MFRILYSRKHILSCNCSDDVKDALIESIEMLNFESKPEESRCHINKFVEDNTKNIIKDFIPPFYITSDTIAVLVNAVFFKSEWQSKFKKEKTKNEIFHINNHKTVDVAMMRQVERFYYGMIKQHFLMEIYFNKHE